MKKINVIKYSGKEETFSSKKVYDSVRRSGGSKVLADKIVAEIEKKAYLGIKTSEIYDQVKKGLKKEDIKASLRFNLKKGFRKLGPSGFPFEKYIAELFANRGFKTKINQFIPGHCCTYEIDFTAERDGLLYIGECKYRNLYGGRVHSKDALANYARFLDIKGGRKNVKSVLVTNTKFTSKAIKYSKCVGVDLLGWRFPKGSGLQYLVEKHKLYPITILHSLNKSLLEVFINKKIMMVKDLLEKDIGELSKITRLSQKRLKPLIAEAKVLLT